MATTMANLKEKLLKRDGSICQYCGKETKDGDMLTVDHVVPVMYGGRDTMTDTVLSCHPCNQIKGAWVPWAPSKKGRQCPRCLGYKPARLDQCYRCLMDIPPVELFVTAVVKKLRMDKDYWKKYT